MIWIEFMGPAGVGKSFWFKKVLQADTSLNPERILAEKYLKENKDSYFHRALGYVYKTNFKKEVIVQKVCSDLRNKYIDNYNTSDILHIETFMDGLSNYDSKAVNQLRLADFYHYKITEFKTYADFLDLEDYYLSEDGIMHLNFGDFSKHIKNVRLPDLIINFDAPDDFILENRIKRIKEGRGSLIDRNIKKNELETHVKKYNSTYREKIEKLKSMNVNIFDFKVKRGFSELNVQMLLEVIRGIQK